MEFKRLFLGETQNSSKTWITNPQVLNLFFDEQDQVLVASTRVPLIIRNEALGFLITYELIHFQYNYRTQMLTSYGVPLFKAISTNKKRSNERWEAERLQTYQGSFSHFLKALQRDQLKENNFDLYTLFRVPNPMRPNDAYLNKQIIYWRAKAGTTQGRDSLAFYENLFTKPKVVDSVGIKIERADVLLNKHPENYLAYHGLLLLVYHESEEAGFRFGKPLPYQKTVIHFTGKGLQFYTNGYYEDVRDLYFEGYMGWSEKLPNMLPLDYIVKQ